MSIKKMIELGEQAQKNAREAAARAKEAASKALDKTEENLRIAGEFASETLATTREIVSDVADKTGKATREFVGDMAERAEAVAKDVAEKAKDTDKKDK